MSQFDLKRALVKLVDGRQATLTTTAGVGVNGEIILTDASKHRGTMTPITITIVVGGVSTALTVVVTGTNIVVNGATDGMSVGTTTAAQMATAILAATSIVTIAQAGTGAGLISAQAITSLAAGPRSLQMKIYEGTVNYDEKVNRVYVMDRGLLSEVRNGDEVPMDVKFSAIWDFVQASSGSGTPTVEDVLKNRGEAAAWVTTDEDTCRPYCIDVEITYDPLCSPTKREVITLPYFRYEDDGRGLKDGSLAISGKCNVTQATSTRLT